MYDGTQEDHRGLPHVEYAMMRLLTILALLFLPLIRGGHVVTVTGTARWEADGEDFGPVAGHWFALLEVISEDPFLIFRHNSESPHARSGARGRFAFQGVEDGKYVLGIKDRPPFGWAPLWDDTTLCLVVVKGKSVELGIVRVGLGVERADGAEPHGD